MSNTTITNPTAGVKFAGIIISMACLSVSVYQGGGFISNLALTEHGRAMLFLAAFAIIAGGQVLARLIGFAIRDGAPAWMIALAAIVMMTIAAFSISTSANELTKRAFERVDYENKTSPEYQRLLDQESEYKAQLAELRENRNTMPVTWITKRSQASESINAVSGQLERLRRSMRLPGASVTEKTLNAVESSTGLKPTHIAIIFALILDILPLSINLLLGFSADRRREERAAALGDDQPKKPQPTLRMVG